MAKTLILRDEMIPDDAWLEQERPVREKAPASPDDVRQDAGLEPENPVLKAIADDVPGQVDNGGGQSPELEVLQPVEDSVPDGEVVSDEKPSPIPVDGADNSSENGDKSPEQDSEPENTGDSVEKDASGQEEELTDTAGSEEGRDNQELTGEGTDDGSGLGGINGSEEVPLLPEEDTPLKPGDIVKDNHGNQWEIIEFIGRGGFAQTYKVKLLGTQFDYKILKEFCPLEARRNVEGVIITKSNGNTIEGRPKFEREPKRISEGSLHLDELPKDRVAISISDLFKYNGNSYFLQEYVEGKTLMEFMKKSGDAGTPMTVGLALQIIEQLAESVKAIHEKNVVHQDISPHNFIFRIKADGAVALKVIDFGVSTTIGKKGSQGGFSFINVGLPGFYDQNMANIPKNEERMKVDVYSMAAVLNYMLFLEYEHVGDEINTNVNWFSLECLTENQPYVMKASREEEQKREAIIALIRRCIAPAMPGRLYNPGFRPTADEFLSEIRRIKAGFRFDGVDRDTLVFNIKAAPEHKLINFTSDIGWWAEKDVDWLKLDRETGEKGGSLLVKVDPNLSVQPREGRIILSNSVHSLACVFYQEAGVRTKPDIRFPLGTKPRTVFPNGGDEREITFTATDDWVAAVSSDGHGWLSVDRLDGTAGIQTVHINAGRNTLPASRQATVTFSCGAESIRWTVEQQPAEKHYLKFVDGTITRHRVKDTGDTVSFSIDTNTDWQVKLEPAVDWVIPERYFGPAGILSLNLMVTANETTDIRETTVRVYNNSRQDICFVIIQNKRVVKVQPKPEPVNVQIPVERVQPKKKAVSRMEPIPAVKPGPKPTGSVIGGQPKQQPEKKKVVQHKDRNFIRWAVATVLMLVLGTGGYFYFGGSGSPQTVPETRQPVTSGVQQPVQQVQQEPAVQVSTADSLDAVFVRVINGQTDIEQVLEHLAPEVQIYELYGDNEVEVSSTIRQLLQRENQHIVFGKTHRVVEVYTDGQTGRIDEIIIQKK